MPPPRAIHPLALGRKNRLFAGSDNGGRSAATIYTIIQTAILNGHDPEAYLADILARIADHPQQPDRRTAGVAMTPQEPSASVSRKSRVNYPALTHHQTVGSNT